MSKSKESAFSKGLATGRRAVLAVLNMGALSSLHVARSTTQLVILLCNIASAAQVLLGVLVVDEKLAVLAVAVGLVARNRNDIEYAGCLVEDCVHLLQGSIGSLRVEEVNDRNDECVAIGN
jgi:hypothetical protein